MNRVCVVSVTVNLQGTTVERCQRSEQDMFGRHSYGKYMAAAGADRLFGLLDAHRIRATVFVPGAEADAHPALVRRLARSGHEIAAHGLAMERHDTLGHKEEAILTQAHKILTDVTGVPPRGWRAPHGRLSMSTLSHLATLGYSYDASFQDDDIPYRLDSDGGAGMIELPQNEMLIDATLYGARQTQERLMQNWCEETQALHGARLGVCLTLHPRSDYGSARASRIAALDSFLAWLRELPDVAFMTCAEICDAAQGGRLPCRP